MFLIYFFFKKYVHKLGNKPSQKQLQALFLEDSLLYKSAGPRGHRFHSKASQYLQDLLFERGLFFLLETPGESCCYWDTRHIVLMTNKENDISQGQGVDSTR